MKKLVYLFVFTLLLTDCVKDDEKPPNTDNLPKRIKTVRFYEHNVETKRILYTYGFDEILKLEFYERTGVNNEWEVGNEMVFLYDLPKVSATISQNFLGTWTAIARIDYIIEEGQILNMDDYTNFSGNWRHDVSTTYTYNEDQLQQVVIENFNQDTVSYTLKQNYQFVNNQVTESVVSNLVDGDWVINQYYIYNQNASLTEILGFASDSSQVSKVKNTYVGDLISKKQSFKLASNGDDLELSSTENFQYFQVKHLLYSDLQTPFLYQNVEYGYENAEGNYAWFHDPQEIMEGTPKPLKSNMVSKLIQLSKKTR